MSPEPMSPETASAEPVFPDLKLEDFAPYVGKVFNVVAEGYHPYPLTLVSATAIPNRSTLAMTRPPFDLRFTGPGPGYLPQDTWGLEHPTLGVVPVCIIPRAQNADGYDYQATFY